MQSLLTDGAPSSVSEFSTNEGLISYAESIELPKSQSVAQTLQGASPVPVSTTTTASGRTGKLDIDRDVYNAKKLLNHLKKDEVKDLFSELGLFDATVHNEYSASLNVYTDDLLRAWILGKDGVLQSETYQGGATWENLRNALRTLNHHGIAKTI
jgi:hypothetical protein